ncbi:MAG: transposase [Methylocystis sp.]|nr:transposase [Methylocystis sp.]
MSADHGPKGWHSRGYLPHFDSPECIQHVVFRTARSIPKALLAALQSESRSQTEKIDAYLDRSEGERPLAEPDLAKIVEGAIRHFDGVRYRLFAWCVMPNHVHVVAETIAEFSFGNTVRSWKAFSAAKINRATGAHGPFWAPDYFDRYMRNQDDLARTVAYVERNPVAAGLAAAPADWPWSSARLSKEELRA